MKVTCFSSFTFSYLDRARVLFESVRRHHPEWETIALVTDDIPTTMAFDPANEPFDRVVFAEELGIPQFRSWLFKHDIVEVCTAVKGPFLAQLCESEADIVVYLDPDICLYNRLDPVVDVLGRFHVVLTPHLTSPELSPEGILDNEMGALKAGIYNLGFVAIRTDGPGLSFAEWWSDRLLSFCYDDVPNGLFVDQKWCDHVPALFDSVHVLRDPGYNVASWNVGRRPITIGHDGQAYADGHLLRFWHYTKLGPVGDVMTKKYARDNFEVYELWRWYKKQVALARVPELPDRYWAFDAFEDGTKIERSHRLLYRQRDDLRQLFEDPFLSGPGTFQSWLADEGLLRPG